MRAFILFLAILAGSRVEAKNCLKNNENSIQRGLKVDLSSILDESFDKESVSNAEIEVWANTTREYDNKKESISLEEFYSESQQSFVFPAYSLLPGNYTVTLTFTSKRKSSFSSVSCFWTMEPFSPIALISGGTSRSVSSDTAVLLKGEDSVDDSVSIETTKRKMYFTWFCTQKKATENFCTSGIMSKSQYFAIPGKYIKAGEVFNVSLKVESSFGLSSVFHQQLFVEEMKVYDLIIKCELNCPPVSDHSSINEDTFLMASCMNCPISDDSSVQGFNWSIKHEFSKDFVFDFEKNTDFGRFDQKLTIKKSSLQPGKYFVSVGLGSGQLGRAEMILNYDAPPKIEQCLITPNQGFIMKTKFFLSCVPSTSDLRDFYYELILGEFEEQLLLSGSLNSISNQSFFLPQLNEELFVKVTAKSGVSTVVELKKTIVKESLIGSDKPKIIFRKTLPPLPEKIEYYEELKKYLLFQVSDFYYKEEEQEKIVAKILNTAKEMNLDKDNEQSWNQYFPNLKLFYCNFLIRNFFKNLNKHKFPRNINNIQDKFEKLYKHCQEKSSFKSIAGFQKYDFGPQRIVLENIYNSTMTKAKMLVKTLPNGSNKTITDSETELLVMKGGGQYFTNRIINMSSTIIHLPKDLQIETHILDVLIAVLHLGNITTKLMDCDDPTNTTSCLVPTTPIVALQIWHSNCAERINTIQFPIKLSFQSNIKSEGYIHEDFIVPESYSSLPDEDLNSYIQVYKFKWESMQEIYVTFQNISNYIFQVVIVSSKYPTIEDFNTKKTTISRVMNTIHVKNRANTEVLGYVGILADFNSNYDDISIRYSLSFVGVQCYMWHHILNEWSIDRCSSNYGDGVATCECVDIGIYAARINVVHAHTQDLKSDHFTLKLESRSFVFIVEAILLFMYFVMIVFTAMKMPKDLYYLSDNIRTHRYCYLVIVKTANSRNAGTTSNIMIKIYGRNSQSLPHVLNYPDPELRLLQRDGEDMFVVATAQHLGEIKKIKVWYNCTGPSPAWTCKDIIIFDMQKRKDWTFKINTKFSVVENGVPEKTFVPVNERSQKQGLCERIKIFNEFHTWHFTTHDQENFSNMKRLTIICSNVMSIQALDLIIHGLPSIHLRDSIDYYEYFTIDAFTVYSGIFSALLSFLIHISIAWTFRFSKIKFPRYEQSSIPLPYKATIACWTVLILIMLLSTSILLTFGFWVPYYSGLVWFVSSSIAVANDVLIYENIFILVRTKVSKIKLTDDIEQHYSQIVKAVESQRALLHRKLGMSLLRPYVEHMYRKMDPYEIKEKTVLVQQRRSIVVELEDLAMFGIYIFILLLSIFANRYMFAVVANQALEPVLDGSYTQTLMFDEVNTIVKFYDYVNTSLLPVLHPTEWYDKYTIANEELLMDANTKILGVVRIRQHRMRSDTCEVSKKVEFLNLTCTPEYSSSDHENRDFNKFWTRPTTNNPYADDKSIWKFHTASYTGTQSITGQFAGYPGSGYIAIFGRSLTESQEMLQLLEETNWIDDKTRCIFIEFLTYNANCNVFSAIKIQLEISASGYIDRRIDIQTERMLYRYTDWAGLPGITYVIYVFWVAVVFVKQFIVLLKKYRTFYKNIWFAMDLFLNITSIISITLFFTRMLLIERYIKKLEKTTYNEFISYSQLFIIEDVMTHLQAALVTVGTIRLWRYLRFGRIFRIMERTLFLAADGLVGSAFGFGLVLIAFGISGILIFGNDFPEFSTMMAITRTLITMCLKPDQFEITSFIETNIAYFYFTCYLILMQINMCMFVVVIVIAYMQAQLEFSDEKDKYNIKHYIQDQLTLLPNLLKYKFLRLRGGQTNIGSRQWVYPKADEFLYADSVSTEVTTMNSMYVTAKCCLRNKNKRLKTLTEENLGDMLTITRYIIGIKRSFEVTVFFKGRIEKQPVRLVDEKKIELVANAAQSLLVQMNEPQSDEIKDSQKQDDNANFIKCSAISKRNQRVIKQTSLRLLILVNMLTKATLDFN